MNNTIKNDLIVLLVDDEEEALDTFSLFLRTEGIERRSFRNECE